MNWGRHGRHSLDDAKARFLSKTQRAESGCLIWTGAKNGSKRYGSCSVMGRQMLAHRAAYMLFVGDTGAAFVCHRCDNGFCVEPSHLFLGSQTDNMRDMESKGRARHPSGLAHGRSKITPESAAAVARMNAAGESNRAIAKQLGVSKTTIARVLSGDHWTTT